jgi:ABC-type nitrate/sulfonate/bicarbonate transport system substrate-binding protein
VKPARRTILFSGAAAFACAGRAYAQTPATIRVLRGAIEASSGAEYGAQLGLFKKYGLDVRFLVNGWYARVDWAAANRENVRRFARAITEAQDWANKNRDESGKMPVAFNKVDPAIVAKMTRATFAPRLDRQLLQPVIDAAARYGAIASPFPAGELIAAT